MHCITRVNNKKQEQTVCKYECECIKIAKYLKSHTQRQKSIYKVGLKKKVKKKYLF